MPLFPKRAPERFFVAPHAVQFVAVQPDEARPMQSMTAMKTALINGDVAAMRGFLRAGSDPGQLQEACLRQAEQSGAQGQQCAKLIQTAKRVKRLLPDSPSNNSLAPVAASENTRASNLLACLHVRFATPKEPAPIENALCNHDLDAATRALKKTRIPFLKYREKIKQVADGSPVYVVNFYDPNTTTPHHRVRASDLNDIKKLAIADFVHPMFSRVRTYQADAVVQIFPMPEKRDFDSPPLTYDEVNALHKAGESIPADQPETFHKLLFKENFFGHLKSAFDQVASEPDMERQMRVLEARDRPDGTAIQIVHKGARLGSCPERPYCPTHVRSCADRRNFPHSLR